MTPDRSSINLNALISSVQVFLTRLYDLHSGHRATDFLYLTELGTNTPHEQLLAHETGETLELAIELDRNTIETLLQQNPFRHLNEQNLQAFWLVVEGISHFVCLSWNATHEKKISALELELQAEIDKYLLTRRLLQNQYQKKLWPWLNHALFAAPKWRYAPRSDIGQRYFQANEWAKIFCQYLEKRLATSPNRQQELARLRRFYRSSRTDKVRQIQRLGNAFA